MTGLIFDIKEFAVHDGEGIRTTVFLKGCPLRCVWCHNPEGLSPKRELYLKQNGCLSCGLCRKPCDHPECREIGRCLHICPQNLVSAVGQEWKADALAEKLLKHKRFFNSMGGGITLSGGEPLLQADFAREIFTLCHANGINTCLDTSGSILNDSVKALLRETDRVLLDIKYTREEMFRENVGCTMQSALDFLRYLDDERIPVTVRQVIIPTVNDDRENMLALKKIVQSHPCVDKVELLPFRKICQTKYDAMKLDFPFGHLPEGKKAVTDELHKILEE